MTNVWVSIISGFLIVLGTLGAVLPFLPGLPLAWLGLFIYSYSSHFPQSLIWGLVVFGFLIGLTIIVDILAPALVAKGHKASNLAVLGALIGAIAGIMVLGPIGILLGPFLGAFLGEMISARNAQKAFSVAISSLLGLLIGSFFKLLVGVSMLIYFLWIVI